MEGLKKILGSFKGSAFVISVIALVALVVGGHVEADAFIEWLKWGFGTLVTARAGEEGLKALGGGKEKPEAALVAELVGKALADSKKAEKPDAGS